MSGTATAPRRAATAASKVPALAMDFVKYGLGFYRVRSFVPGGRGPGVDINDTLPRPCLVLTFLLPDPAAYDTAVMSAVNDATARCRKIRDDFATHPTWLNVLSIEKRLAALVEEQKVAKQKAESEALKMRTAITAGDRAAESAAAVAVKAAEAEGADAANRHRILAGQLPAARNVALEALTALLREERQRLEEAAVAETRALAAELTAAVAGIAARLASSNARAGVASADPVTCLGHHGPSSGLVGEFAKLPH